MTLIFRLFFILFFFHRRKNILSRIIWPEWKSNNFSVHYYDCCCLFVSFISYSCIYYLVLEGWEITVHQDVYIVQDYILTFRSLCCKLQKFVFCICNFNLQLKIVLLLSQFLLSYLKIEWHIWHKTLEKVSLKRKWKFRRFKRCFIWNQDCGRIYIATRWQARFHCSCHYFLFSLISACDVFSGRQLRQQFFAANSSGLKSVRLCVSLVNNRTCGRKTADYTAKVI